MPPSPAQVTVATLRRALLWPMLLCTGLVGTGIGMALDQPLLGFNLSYVAVAVALWALERRWPHEPEWLENDGQMLPDLLHTLLTKGLVGAVDHDGVRGSSAESSAADRFAGGELNLNLIKVLFGAR